MVNISIFEDFYRLTETGQTCSCWGEGAGGGWSGGSGVADANCYTGWTSNKVLMCRPGGQSQYPVMNCSGKECTNMYKVCELLRRVWLCNPAGCSSLGSSVHGILQARTLGWVAMPFSRGSSRPKDQIFLSCVSGRFFTVWATSEAPTYVCRNVGSLCCTTEVNSVVNQLYFSKI